jgi:hypothetical protein
MPKPGVIESIIEILREHDESNPISKTAIVQQLAVRFPDRSEKSMKSTVDQQVPSKLRKERGLMVRKNKRGCWLPKSGSGNGSPTPPTIRQMIRIDPEVWVELQKRATPFIDTPNDVLRRLLNLNNRKE